MMYALPSNYFGNSTVVPNCLYMVWSNILKPFQLCSLSHLTSSLLYYFVSVTLSFQGNGYKFAFTVHYHAIIMREKNEGRLVMITSFKSPLMNE